MSWNRTSWNRTSRNRTSRNGKQARIRVIPAPWSYRPGRTPLHRAPPLLKLAGLPAITGAALIFRWPGIAWGAALVLGGAFLARIRPWELLRGAKPVIVIIILTVILRSLRFFPPALDLSGSGETAALCLTLLLSFSAGALLFAVTAPEEIRESLLPFTGPRFSLAFSLTLGFLPRFFEAWEESSCAWKARGGRGAIRALCTLLPLVIERMILLAGETAAALESRGA